MAFQGFPHRRRPKSVLITGCSSGGLGYALAEEFAKKGCRVYATARKPERMRGLDRLGCTLIELDTTDLQSIDAAVDQVLHEEPLGPDILINNAGAAMRGPVLDCPLAESRRLFDVNYFGAVAMVRALAPHMIRRRSGTIVNIGSASGFWSTPFMSHYSASKAALQALSDSLRLELSPFNVRVVHAAPGFIRTEIFNKGQSAGNILVDSRGPFGSVVDDVDGDVFSTIGRSPVTASAFAGRFVRMALSARPPALYLDGRWALSTYLTGLYAPRFLVDWFSYFFFGCWKLTSWYPWAPPLIESGPGPALLGIKHTPHRVSPPAGVGAAGEDAAGTIKARAQRASRAAAADDPVGGAADRRP